MKNLLTRRKSLIATALLGFSAVTAAQSVGPVRGSAQVGRPLELSVPVRFDRADADSSCAQARVFYGDTRVEPEHVSTEVLRAQEGAMVAVRSRAAVNEPFVTVELRAGCASTMTRRFVLLTEPAADPLPVAVATSPLPDTRSAGAGGLIAATRLASTPAPRVVATPVSTRQAAGKAAGVRAPKAKPAAPRDTLRMQVWTPALEQATLLRMATRLSSPAEDAARRAAAAALWQALSAEPQDLQQRLQELRGLQSEVLVLRASMARSRAEAAGLREQVERQSRFDFTGWLPWLAALLLGAGAAGFAWQRLRRAGVPKWYAALGEDALASRLDTEPEAAAPPAPSKPLERGEAASLPATQEELAQAGLPASRAAALASLVQEVEFLESLGLVRDAIDALKEYLQDTQTPPQVAYFELMRLCARHDDEAGLAAARVHWQRSYGQAPPELARVEHGAGIEAHPELLSRITAAWPTAQALDIIDKRLFGHPLPEENLSLQAWRDLLWLNGMAEAMSGVESNEPGASLDAAPWLARDGAEPEPAAVHPATLREPEPALLGGALDFDLDSKPEPVLAQAAPAPKAPVSPDEDETRPRMPAVKLPLPPLDWVPPSAKEKPKSIATYEDLFDAVMASEGRRAHRQEA